MPQPHRQNFDFFSQGHDVMLDPIPAKFFGFLPLNLHSFVITTLLHKNNFAACLLLWYEHVLFCIVFVEYDQCKDESCIAFDVWFCKKPRMIMQKKRCTHVEPTERYSSGPEYRQIVAFFLVYA